MAGAYPCPVRLILAAAAALAVGVLGALILGEYPFDGPTVLAAGVIFGLFIGEAAVGVTGPQRDLRLTVACVAIGLAAMTWAGWITTSHDLGRLGVAGGGAIALAGASAGLRTGLGLILRTGRTRRAAGTLPGAPAPGASPEERPA
jgi:xanthosine utilization system XapX-like protein